MVLNVLVCFFFFPLERTVSTHANKWTSSGISQKDWKTNQTKPETLQGLDTDAAKCSWKRQTVKDLLIHGQSMSGKFDWNNDTEEIK